MITIKDIAKIAGVSHSTVSRSLNDSSQISKKTKERIKKISEELGFEFNNNARSLSTRRTGTVGIIFNEDFDKENSAFFFNKLLKEFRYSLEKKSLDVILDFRINPFTKKSNIKKLINTRKIDGFLIADEWVDEEDIQFIVEKGIPAVFVHNRPHLYDNSKLDCIVTDHFEGGYLATKQLIELGHKDIVTFTHKKSMFLTEFEERTRGFIKALEENNIALKKSMIIRDEICFDYGREKIKKIMKKNKKITGIFAQTDLLALGIIRGLKEEGYRVPEDVSVIGYDNIEFGKFNDPELTTISQPMERLAEEATKMLINKLSGIKKEEAKHTVIEPSLVIRKSTVKR